MYNNLSRDAARIRDEELRRISISPDKLHAHELQRGRRSRRPWRKPR